MRLDYSCCRALLLALEDSLQLLPEPQHPEYIDCSTTTLDEMCSHPQLSGYERTNIAYCSMKLDEAGFVNIHVSEYDGGFSRITYFSITYEGHHFLDSVRSPRIWSKIKSTFEDKSISLTFDLITQFASKLALGSFLPL